MKGKAVVSELADADEVADALESSGFAEALMNDVISVFGITDAAARPAEFYLQKVDRIVPIGDAIGVEFRLTGVSRGTRPAKMFHEALAALNKLVTTTVQNRLPSHRTVKAQVFVSIMLDKEIEVSPGAGVYSNILEAEAVWVESLAF